MIFFILCFGAGHLFLIVLALEILISEEPKLKENFIELRSILQFYSLSLSCSKPELSSCHIHRVQCNKLLRVVQAQFFFYSLNRGE